MANNGLGFLLFANPGTANKQSDYKKAANRSNNASLSDILVSTETTPTNWTNANNGSLGSISTQDCSSNVGGEFISMVALGEADWVVAVSNYFSRTQDGGATWECRFRSVEQNFSFAVRAGGMANIGNRIFIYSLDSNNFDKGAYFDIP